MWSLGPEVLEIFQLRAKSPQALEIFQLRAKSPQAKIQVGLARLEQPDKRKLMEILWKSY